MNKALLIPFLALPLLTNCGGGSSSSSNDTIVTISTDAGSDDYIAVKLGDKAWKRITAEQSLTFNANKTKQVEIVKSCGEKRPEFDSYRNGSFVDYFSSNATISCESSDNVNPAVAADFEFIFDLPENHIIELVLTNAGFYTFGEDRYVYINAHNKGDIPTELTLAIFDLESEELKEYSVPDFSADVRDYTINFSDLKTARYTVVDGGISVSKNTHNMCTGVEDLTRSCWLPDTTGSYVRTQTVDDGRLSHIDFTTYPEHESTFPTYTFDATATVNFIFADQSFDAQIATFTLPSTDGVMVRADNKSYVVNIYNASYQSNHTINVNLPSVTDLPGGKDVFMYPSSFRILSLLQFFTDEFGTALAQTEQYK